MHSRYGGIFTHVNTHAKAHAPARNYLYTLHKNTHACTHTHNAYEQTYTPETTFFCEIRIIRTQILIDSDRYESHLSVRKATNAS